MCSRCSVDWTEGVDGRRRIVSRGPRWAHRGGGKERGERGPALANWPSSGELGPAAPQSLCSAFQPRPAPASACACASSLPLTGLVHLNFPLCCAESKGAGAQRADSTGWKVAGGCGAAAGLRSGKRSRRRPCGGTQGWWRVYRLSSARFNIVLPAVLLFTALHSRIDAQTASRTPPRLSFSPSVEGGGCACALRWSQDAAVDWPHLSSVPRSLNSKASHRSLLTGVVTGPS